MNAALASTFIVLCVSAVNAQVCAPRDRIAKALQDGPDAGKLIQDTTKATFFLLYHSEDDKFHSKYPCLRVARAPFTTINGASMYVYGYMYKNKLWWNYTSPELHKTDGAYQHDNGFSVDIVDRGKTLRQVFQVIYTDYKHCILFWTSSLGYQVWVESVHLKTRRKAPSTCSFLYDLLAPSKRHVVYMWKKCDL
ncbi:uncharacterized protein LOC119376659 [Rhipicephalus sanguineus]|uniref:uncharacterized protein LOC119376659 n=1 Tax=Rhipicephalus sanguineus TaxID=34632 RepID=UPI001893FCBC|nr:uncharacterized protein LOC119376659 [Rhipicephalus sanguineus]